MRSRRMADGSVSGVVEMGYYLLAKSFLLCSYPRSVSDDKRIKRKRKLSLSHFDIDLKWTFFERPSPIS